MKVCPKCSTEYPDDKQFCPADGTPLGGGRHGAKAPKPPPLPAGKKPKSGAHAAPSASANEQNTAEKAAEKPRKRDNTLMYSIDAPPERPEGPAAPDLASLPDAAPNPGRSTDRHKMVPGEAPKGDVDHNAETRVSSVEDTGEPDGTERSAYIGKLIDDRYLVKSLVGRGGMGAVYRVEQIHLRKEMAIKLLHENLISKKQLVSRFTREARAISRLSSQHTVMVYDFGRWGEVFYLVMELLQGEALDEALVREGPMPPRRTTAILLQMCDSLSEAHSAGIVHRDLKPENIMLQADGPHPDFVKILDFGLAKVEDVDDPYTIHSQKDIFGTPFYMSPEQIRAGDIDGRSDIYAVGALAFRMLTGQQVFGQEKSTFDILKAHLMEPPRKMSEVTDDIAVPDALEHIVARCLAKAPKDRFQSMDELAAALVEARKSDFTSAGIEPPRESTAHNANISAAEKKRTDALLADEDALEGHVRRTGLRQRLSFVGMVLVFVAAAVAAVMALSGGGVGLEQEPNDTPGQANQLDEAGEAKGSIGKRRSREMADKDCFKLPPLAPNDDLSIFVRGIPTMDLELSLIDGAGVARVVLSHRGEGRGEVLRHVDTRFGPRVLCLTERAKAGKVAGESLSDMYTLRVERKPRAAWTETEPNDGKRSNSLPGGKSIGGTLDGPFDIDVFQLAEQFEGRILRIHLASATDRSLEGLRVAVHDAKGRVLTAEQLREGAKESVLAFAATDIQEPHRIVVHWSAQARKDWKPGADDEIHYKMWYRIEDVSDQGETEPNNTAASAAPMVLGAWHVGAAVDAAGVDWLRIDAGDPNMRRIRLEASAPKGSAFWLTVRDLGTNVDVRKLQVTPSTNDHDVLIHGSGVGFLLKIERLEKPQPASKGSRYRLRARWAQPGGDDLKLELPGH
ncbi:MAG: protein kinase [Myxococcales bacterium]|nr:protein kinase [Myxococcales bacterium]